MDTELMRRLQNGEDDVLNDIIKRWQHPLISFLIRYNLSETDAIDLAQETFVRVYQNRARFKPAAKFSTWLFAIALNLSKNQQRWRNRHPTVPIEQHLDTPRLNRTPLHDTIDSELGDLVREEIAHLSEDLRSVLILKTYNDLSHSEIAEIVRCTTKAVETRLYRARQILRERLSKHLQ